MSDHPPNPERVCPPEPRRHRRRSFDFQVSSTFGATSRGCQEGHRAPELTCFSGFHRPRLGACGGRERCMCGWLQPPSAGLKRHVPVRLTRSLGLNICGQPLSQWDTGAHKSQLVNRAPLFFLFSRPANQWNAPASLVQHIHRLPCCSLVLAPDCEMSHSALLASSASIMAVMLRLLSGRLTILYPLSERKAMILLLCASNTYKGVLFGTRRVRRSLSD